MYIPKMFMNAVTSSTVASTDSTMNSTTSTEATTSNTISTSETTVSTQNSGLDYCLKGGVAFVFVCDSYSVFSLWNLFSRGLLQCRRTSCSWCQKNTFAVRGIISLSSLDLFPRTNKNGPLSYVLFFWREINVLAGRGMYLLSESSRSDPTILTGR